MNSGLDQDETEFAVDVLAVALQMLSDGHGLLDQVVQVLGDVGFEADRLHDAQDLVAIDKSDLGYSMGVTKNDTCKEKDQKCYLGRWLELYLMGKYQILINPELLEVTPPTHDTHQFVRGSNPFCPTF